VVNVLVWPITHPKCSDRVQSSERWNDEPGTTSKKKRTAEMKMGAEAPIFIPRPFTALQKRVVHIISYSSWFALLSRRLKLVGRPSTKSVGAYISEKRRFE
jgi:hypothetical protein